VFSHNGSNTDTHLQFAKEGIICCDTPGGAAELRTRDRSLPYLIAFY